MELNAPMDNLHQECLDAVRVTRAQFVVLRKRASKWEPRPYPKGEKNGKDHSKHSG